MFLLASVLFAYQLYCDFSACTDIAIGSGEMFGIRLMENFRRPLGSTQLSPICGAAGISASQTGSEIIFISPWEAIAKEKLRQYLNQIIVFLVSGLWHGATLTFVVWGL